MRSRIIAAGVACLALAAGMATTPASAGPGANDRVFFELPFPTEGDVSGRVFFPDGTPAAGAVVNVIGFPEQMDITNRFGRYSIENVESPIIPIQAFVLANGMVFGGTGFSSGSGTVNIILRPAFFPIPPF